MSKEKQLYLSVLVHLPADPFEAAEIYAKLKEPWLALSRAIAESGVKYDIKLEDLEGRINARMPRRPRKPRLVPSPAGEAA